MYRFNKKEQKDFRKSLRRNMTEPERKLWLCFRARQYHGLKIRRQHGIGKYVVDFYITEKQVAIEVDGDTHAENAEYDNQRTAYLNRQGIRVIRFTNREVMDNLDGVLEEISKYI